MSWLALWLLLVLLPSPPASAGGTPDDPLLPPLGAPWRQMSRPPGIPAGEAPWGEGRAMFFRREDRELQVYLDQGRIVEGVLILYPDGVELAGRPGLLERLAAERGVFVKLTEEKEPKRLRFQGMIYLRTPDGEERTEIVVTGPRKGYQRLYVEGSVRADRARPFYRQLVDQIRAKIRWNPEDVSRLSAEDDTLSSVAVTHNASSKQEA